MLRWSKRIAIEYIEQMKSPVEEISLASQSTGKLGQTSNPIIDRLRMAAQKRKVQRS